MFVNGNARKFQGAVTGSILITLGFFAFFQGSYPAFAFNTVLALMCLAYYKGCISAVKYNFIWGILSGFCLVASPFWGMDGCSFIGSLGMVLFFATAFDAWRRGDTACKK